ncbi:hypothetical protein HDE_08532 [Halotydeus destructor]|nr:hypothetical protein HDE_08532 [Halotydeus destructor]
MINSLICVSVCVLIVNLFRVTSGQSPPVKAIKCHQRAPGQNVLCFGGSNNVSSFGAATGCFGDMSCESYLELTLERPGRLFWKLGHLHLDPLDRTNGHGHNGQVFAFATKDKLQDGDVFPDETVVFEVGNNYQHVYCSRLYQTWYDIDGYYDEHDPQLKGVYTFTGLSHDYKVGYFNTSSKLLHPKNNPHYLVDLETDYIYLTIVHMDYLSKRIWSVFKSDQINIYDTLTPWPEKGEAEPEMQYEAEAVSGPSEASAQSDSNQATIYYHYGVSFMNSDANYNCLKDGNPDDCDVVIDGHYLPGSRYIDWNITKHNMTYDDVSNPFAKFYEIWFSSEKQSVDNEDQINDLSNQAKVKLPMTRQEEAEMCRASERKARDKRKKLDPKAVGAKSSIASETIYTQLQPSGPDCCANYTCQSFKLQTDTVIVSHTNDSQPTLFVTVIKTVTIGNRTTRAVRQSERLQMFRETQMSFFQRCWWLVAIFCTVPLFGVIFYLWSKKRKQGKSSVRQLSVNPVRPEKIVPLPDTSIKQPVS